MTNLLSLQSVFNNSINYINIKMVSIKFKLIKRIHSIELKIDAFLDERQAEFDATSGKINKYFGKN